MNLLKRLPYARYVVLFLIATIGVTTSLDNAMGQIRNSPSRERPASDKKAISKEINGSQECSTTYDRFKNIMTTTIDARTIYRASVPRHEIKMSASAVVEKGDPPKEVDLIFDAASESARTRFYDKVDIMFIVDGERTEGGTAYKMGGLSMRQFDEKLRLTLTASRFVEIISGREVEMQIGKTEVTLRDEDLNRLRRFAACAGLQRK